MTTSSADPERLRHFTEGAAPLTARLRASGEGVTGAYRAFRQSGSAYGGDLGSLSAFVQVLADLSANEAFVKAVTEALLAADSHRTGVVTLPDATLAAALKAAGVGAPPPYLTLGPSSLFGMPPTSGFVDDPVCAATGNFFHHEADLPFPGRAGILGLARSYNSLAVFSDSSARSAITSPRYRSAAIHRESHVARRVTSGVMFGLPSRSPPIQLPMRRKLRGRRPSRRSQDAYSCGSTGRKMSRR